MLRHKEPYVLYRKLLGFYPTDIHLYEQACLHRSSSICEQGRRINNERLEFLGDAILDAIVADILFHKFKTSKEGFLTNTRAKIVKRESLNEIAVKLGLDNFITYSMRTSSHNNYMFGNAFEALIGAIYLDKGYRYCKKFVETRIIDPYIDLEKISKEEFNFKSRLIEWGQKTQSRYRICTDRDHRRPRQQPRIPIASPARRYIRRDRNRILQKRIAAKCSTHSSQPNPQRQKLSAIGISHSGERE